MPWGSAIGSESDGDMNRLVRQFGWNATELAGFYLNVGYLGLTALAAAYAYAVYRFLKRKRGQTPFSRVSGEAPLGLVLGDLLGSRLVGALVDGNLEVVLVFHHLRVERGVFRETSGTDASS